MRIIANLLFSKFAIFLYFTCTF